MEIVINYWVVLVAAVIAFGVGGVWYSPVMFQKRWMHLLGDTGQQKGGLSPTQAMGIEFGAILLASYVLAQLVVLINVVTLSAALQLGFWLWLGFQAPMLLAGVLFERRPFQLFLINAGQRLVAILVMVAILGSWH